MNYFPRNPPKRTIRGVSNDTDHYSVLGKLCCVTLIMIRQSEVEISLFNCKIVKIEITLIHDQ